MTATCHLLRMELRLLHLAQWLMVGFPDHTGMFLADSCGAPLFESFFFLLKVFGHLQVMWMSVNLGCICLKSHP